MGRFWYAVCGATVALASTSVGQAEEKVPKQLRKLYAMTPEDHAAKVQIVDDALELEAQFSTIDSFQWKQGFLASPGTDIFVRAFVDKSSGAASFQVYFLFNQVAPQWPRYYSVNFETPLGIQSASLENIGNDVRCGTSFGMVQCTYVEHLVFDVPEQLLRDIAAGYTPNSSDGWDLRFKAQSGADGNIAIMPAEVAGLLLRVDQYRALKSKP